MHHHPLSNDETHLWFTFPDDIKDLSLLSSYWDLMTPDEKKRHDRFRFPEHRHQFLVSRGMIRTTLAKYTHIPPESIRFKTNTYGRPEISERHHPHIRFNLSHTSGLILLGIIQKEDIGVDVEDMTRDMTSYDIAKRYFSEKEAGDVEMLEQEQKRNRFFDYWTLKESYIKAKGKGLSIPLDHFSFTLKKGAPITITFDSQLKDNPSHWHFFLLKPTPRHKAALSICRPSDQPIRLILKKTIPLKEETCFDCSIGT